MAATLQVRWNGKVWDVQVCLSQEQCTAILDKFSDHIVDLDAAKALPFELTTPAQRAWIEAQVKLVAALAPQREATKP